MSEANKTFEAFIPNRRSRKLSRMAPALGRLSVIRKTLFRRTTASRPIIKLCVLCGLNLLRTSSATQKGFRLRHRFLAGRWTRRRLRAPHSPNFLFRQRQDSKRLRVPDGRQAFAPKQVRFRSVGGVRVGQAQRQPQLRSQRSFRAAQV